MFPVAGLDLVPPRDKDDLGRVLQTKQWKYDKAIQKDSKKSIIVTRGIRMVEYGMSESICTYVSVGMGNGLTL